MRDENPAPEGGSWRALAALGVLGELLVTFAVLIGGFVLWYAYIHPWTVGISQEQVAAEQSRAFMQEMDHAAESPAASSSAADASGEPGGPAASAAAAGPLAVPVMAEPERVADAIGVIYVPRFGDSWRRVVRQSVDTERVLNSLSAGVGHYPGTAMPGGQGNFAVAAHDIGYGNSFLNVSKLRLGDRIYIQTQQGWYTYAFRNFQFVQPEAVDVLNAVPTVSHTVGQDRFITLTTCYPAVFPPLERLAAYGTFVGFDVAPPSELAPHLKKDG
ncbi:hypothetical protein SCMU_28890 [Sinomonas cyclohexanicum]|uniref:Class E sortase n=1 Tax=Sinomonas cyclohexanicum TaxID=322009 RepID=A0ABN6FJI9_SINCY|nr:hypothetical protein SCMU_28890 [Corynebacterium cyclohexanicum]